MHCVLPDCQGPYVSLPYAELLCECAMYSSSTARKYQSLEWPKDVLGFSVGV